MAGSGDEQHVLAIPADDTVEVGIDEVQSRVVPQCPNKRGLVSSARRGCTQERVGAQIDLSDGEVVGGPPPAVHQGQPFIHSILGPVVRGCRGALGCRLPVRLAHGSDLHLAGPLRVTVSDHSNTFSPSGQPLCRLRLCSVGPLPATGPGHHPNRQFRCRSPEVPCCGVWKKSTNRASCSDRDSHPSKSAGTAARSARRAAWRAAFPASVI